MATAVSTPPALQSPRSVKSKKSVSSVVGTITKGLSLRKSSKHSKPITRASQPREHRPVISEEEDSQQPPSPTTSNQLSSDERSNVKNNAPPSSSKPPFASSTTQSSLSPKSKMAQRIATRMGLPTQNSPSAQPPSPLSGNTAKGLREMALRERGLLPPKDMSQLEREQDRRLGITPLQPQERDGEASPSAADLIKREWEDRNRVSFNSQDSSDKEPQSSGSTSTHPPSPPQVISPSTPPRALPPCHLPSTPTQPILNPCDVALPPSPSPSTTEYVSQEGSHLPTSVPVQDNFTVATNPVADLHSTDKEEQESSMASGVILQDFPLPPALTPPPASLTQLTPPQQRSDDDNVPSAGLTLPTSLNTADSLLIAAGLPSPTESIGMSSIMTPSLTAESVFRTYSSSSASGSDTHAIPPTIITGNAADIPVIVESPAEESFPFSPLHGQVATVYSKAPALVPGIDSDENQFGQIADLGPPTPRPRTRESQTKNTGTRLSIFNLRKSKSTKPAKVPTLPIRSNTSPLPANSPPVRRSALSPTMHSRTSMLVEISGIEDEESRRLSEMAFM